jgi:hypothetical protein
MGQKRPAVEAIRQRDARTYRRLAAWARCHGYREVTQHTVHHWISGGLLPKAQPVPTGFGQRATVQHVDTGRQLLALCRYRYKDKLGRYDLIGAQLWLDGFDLATAFVRDAVAREFVRPADTRPKADEVASSFQIARQRPIIDATPRLSYDERAEVTDEFRGALEDGEEPSPHGMQLISRAMALDVSEAKRVVAGLPRVTPESATQVELALDEDLLSARTAWAHLSAQATPDRHKNGRTRARVRLGLFVSAFLLDATHRGPETRSPVAPLLGGIAPVGDPF